MYCTKCGIELNDRDRFCSQCGTTTGVGGERLPSDVYSRLSRPIEGGKIAGVCAGVARYFGVDVTLIRVLWLALTLCPPGVGLVAYIVCWIVMPRDPYPLPAPQTTLVR